MAFNQTGLRSQEGWREQEGGGQASPGVTSGLAAESLIEFALNHMGQGQGSGSWII